MNIAQTSLQGTVVTVKLEPLISLLHQVV